MRKTAICAVLVVFGSILALQCQAKQEEATPVDDSGEGNLCDQDQKVAKICLACSSLPFNVDVSLVACCSSETGYQFCSACVKDRDSCAELIGELDDLQRYSESDEEYYDDNSNDNNYNELYYDGMLEDADTDRANAMREKRFGTLFLKSPKRYGRLFTGKRATAKRYGRLYMGSGSYFGKRSPAGPSELDSDIYGDNIETSDIDKRFGHILGGSSYKFGKREDESLGDEYALEKRYGQLFMGKSGWFGKRDGDKRFGRLFVGSKGKFGKRSDADDIDVAKRYGRLFMGRRRNKMFG